MKKSLGSIEEVQRVERARTPEDLFPGKLNAAALKRLQLAVHPDGFEAALRARAEAAFKKIGEMYVDAMASPRSAPKKVVIRGWTIDSALCAGDSSNLYIVHDSLNASHVLKVVRDARDNSRIAAEVAALNALSKGQIDRSPSILQRFDVSGCSAVVETLAKDFVSLDDIVSRMSPMYLDFRHVVWMGNRIFGLIDHMNALGLVHGAITPNHMMYHPETHGITLVGWGSSLFIDGKRHVLVEPKALAAEATILKVKGVRDPLSRITIDPDCVIITPWHRYMNQVKESLRRDGSFNSVGVGVGEAREDQILRNLTLKVSDVLLDHAEQKVEHIAARKLAALCKMQVSNEVVTGMLAIQKVLFLDSLNVFTKVAVAPWQAVAPAYDSAAVFEGAQGVLLDETRGFAPYNTWTRCTFENPDSLLREVEHDEIVRLGVLRSYGTRHGSGPFPTENDLIGQFVQEIHNKTHPWMGKFRVGHFDAVLARLALGFCDDKVDGLVLTHLDRIPSKVVAIGRVARDVSDAELAWLGEPIYETVENGLESAKFVSNVAAQLGLPVLLESHGPTWQDKISHLVKF